jgi:hypothetical protein
VLRLAAPAVAVAPPVVLPPPAPPPTKVQPVIQLHNPATYQTANRSWLSEIFDTFIHGIEGQPPVAIDTSKPVGAALAPVVQAASVLGSTVTAAAQTGVQGFLESTVGPPGTALADLALQALITEATNALTPKAAAAIKAAPTT